jgi:hypothetical protein
MLLILLHAFAPYFGSMLLLSADGHEMTHALAVALGGHAR